MQVLDTISYIAKSMLPVIAIIVLVMLGVLIYKLLQFMNNVNLTINKVNQTIDIVDRSIEKLQVPLSTVESLAHSINTLHFFSEKALRGFYGNITTLYNQVKEFISKLFGKPETEENAEEEVVVYENEQ